MAQFHAGYVIEEVMPLLDEAAAANAASPLAARQQVRSLLREISCFEISGWPKESTGLLAEPPGAVRVASNIVSRGLPTRAPLALTRQLLATLWPAAVLRTQAARQCTISYDLGPANLAHNQQLWRALHVLDPRLGPADGASIRAIGTWPLGSAAERRFLLDLLPAHFGTAGSLLWQLVEPQAALRPLLEAAADQFSQPAGYLRQPATGFTGQSLDFALSLPYQAGPAPLTGLRGLLVEVDGGQHRLPPQFRLDNQRDAAALAAGWQPVRLPTDHFASPAAALAPLRQAFEQHTYFQHITQNYIDSLIATNEGRRALQLMLTPLAVARVQRTLLECLGNGTLGWEKMTWRVTVIERDVPCAHLAVAGLRDLLTDLLELEGAGRHLPRIDLQVLGTAEFADAELRSLPGHSAQLFGAAPPAGPTPDLLLDVSMLQRPGFSAAPVGWPAAVRLTVRSAHRQSAPRRFQMGPLLPYLPLVQEHNRPDEYEYPPLPGRVAPLRRLLRDCFRKTDFRPGQLPILSRALQGKSVLGLLPTGGGKSLTYQLAALLQPGVTLVVDPIKSLMQDQYEGLLANWIDGVTFINSAVEGGRAAKEQRVAQLARGELLLAFISPERLVIAEFRAALSRMSQPAQRIGFAYCVIDEAHCVSEWGHDFRTHYLHLGRNARQFCRTYDDQAVPLYALTATASFDVLADVERELDLNEPEAIIRFKSNRRHELDFRVVAAASTAGQDPGPAKHQALTELLRRLPAELRAYDARHAPTAGRTPLPDYEAARFYEPAASPPAPPHFAHAGLVFCPHRNKRFSGVSAVRASVQQLPEFRNRTGYFMAADEALSQADQEAESRQLADTQRDFVQSRLNLLVATKAFGMGIDKPNVRFTVHYSHPGSIESFIQESGRAGRDRRSALSYVLFHPTDKETQEEFHRGSFKGQAKESALVYELLTKVTFPASQPRTDLLARLAADTGLMVSSLRIGWPKPGQPRVLVIYLDQSYGHSYGRVYFDAQNGFRADLSYCHADIFAEGEQVLQWFTTHLPALAPRAAQATLEALAAWLSPPPEPGILPRLAGVAAGQRPEPLLIGFTNDALDQVRSIAQQYRLNPAYLESLTKTVRYANGGEDFAKSLGQRADTDCGQALARQWLRYRDVQSTMKAVHRLATLGVVEDYTMDYGASLITLILAPKPTRDTAYLEELENYLLRYTTRQRARELRQATPERTKGSNLLEKCLGQMLEFTYKVIAAKRLAAIREMHEALTTYGLAEKPSMSLADFCDLYLNSKYVRQEFLPDDTLNGQLVAVDTLWTYLRYMAAPPDGQGEVQDNVKHLRGACARLLPSYPDHAALKMLDGFAVLFLENHKPTLAPADPQARKTGETKLIEGLLGFGKMPEYADPAALTELARHFADATGRYDERTARFVRDAADTLALRLHLEWLRELNRRYDDRPIATF